MTLSKDCNGTQTITNVAHENLDFSPNESSANASFRCPTRKELLFQAYRKQSVTAVCEVQQLSDSDLKTIGAFSLALRKRNVRQIADIVKQYKNNPRALGSLIGPMQLQMERTGLNETYNIGYAFSARKGTLHLLTRGCDENFQLLESFQIIAGDAASP